MSKHTSPGNPRVAIAYLRASKDEQRLSPEAQRAGIEAWAERESICVTAWCVDQGVRSVSPVARRPALRAALVALRRHRAGVLVVAKRDRVARDVVARSKRFTRVRRWTGSARRRGALRSGSVPVWRSFADRRKTSTVCIVCRIRGNGSCSWRYVAATDSSRSARRAGGTAPCRSARRRRSTIIRCGRSSSRWPRSCDKHLGELTERVIREAIDDDVSEAPEAEDPKALPEADAVTWPFTRRSAGTGASVAVADVQLGMRGEHPIGQQLAELGVRPAAAR